MFNVAEMSAKDAKKVQKLKAKIRRELCGHPYDVCFITAEEAAFLAKHAIALEFQATLRLKVTSYSETSGDRLSFLEPYAFAENDSH